MRILIVDDEKASCAYLKEIFAVLGDCDMAGDGGEAVTMFKNALDESNPYQLICMDISMPDMDGMKATKLIRDEEEKHVRQGGESSIIIMTTAMYNSNTVVGSFKGGCDGYLVKPITSTHVGKLLRDLGLTLKFEKKKE